MRIVQFVHPLSPNNVCVGVLQDNVVIDITHIAPTSLSVISGSVEEKLMQYLDTKPPGLNLQELELKAPVTGMDKVICIGMNYKDHCEEQGMPCPTEPVVFNKFPSCVVAPFADVPYPPTTEQLDWEVELVVVVGKEGYQIEEKDAYDYVFGYTVGHDISARDWQLKRNGGQWLIGKSMNAFAPIGPGIVSRDEIPDPHNLNLSCKVNGATKQDSSTKEMVFNVPQIIAWLSRFFPILPGDLIFTGTPPGVGVFKNPPEFLKKGDVVTCGIESIGEIRNKIV